ncbi:unnamed protein product [Euphydryas editha]|uniref:Uncharacterized protein n=1 Tax=Euphydryas editha TaxID=104508 RepID=A0AAU9TZK0_EUPED|nr:unnamed protein product [Euphydryas editha]
MSLDIMFLTNDNLHRMRKEPQVLGLRYRGLSNGVENDQNTANISADLSHTRLSISSTASNQSYESGNVDYAVSKHSYNQKGRVDNIDANDNLTYNQLKISNPLFGVNAASHYSPSSILETTNDTKMFERLPNGIRKAPEGQDNETFKTEDAIDGRKELIMSQNPIAIAEGGTATYTTDNNGKINVHVTVMINAGTLADLKKQRAQIRTNGSPVENSANSTSNHSLTSIPEGGKQEAQVQISPPTLTPSTGTVPRFSGHTSDVVGDSKSRRCCIIM